MGTSLLKEEWRMAKHLNVLKGGFWFSARALSRRGHSGFSFYHPLMLTHCDWADHYDLAKHESAKIIAVRIKKPICISINFDVK